MAHEVGALLRISCGVGAVQALQETSCYWRLGSRRKSTNTFYMHYIYIYKQILYAKHILYIALWRTNLIDQTRTSSCYLGRYYYFFK